MLPMLVPFFDVFSAVFYESFFIQYFLSADPSMFSFKPPDYRNILSFLREVSAFFHKTFFEAENKQAKLQKKKKKYKWNFGKKGLQQSWERMCKNQQFNFKGTWGKEV